MTLVIAPAYPYPVQPAPSPQLVILSPHKPDLAAAAGPKEVTPRPTPSGVVMENAPQRAKMTVQL
jgi:hypothetical protein